MPSSKGYAPLQSIEVVSGAGDKPPSHSWLMQVPHDLLAQYLLPQLALRELHAMAGVFPTHSSTVSGNTPIAACGAGTCRAMRDLVEDCPSATLKAAALQAGLPRSHLIFAQQSAACARVCIQQAASIHADTGSGSTNMEIRCTTLSQPVTSF